VVIGSITRERIKSQLKVSRKVDVSCHDLSLFILIKVKENMQCMMSKTTFEKNLYSVKDYRNSQQAPELFFHFYP
jgi:hypothetical protein